MEDYENPTEEASPSEESDKPKIVLSADDVAGYDCSPGDTIKLRVVGKNADGGVECEMIGEEKGGNWQEDFDKSMPESMGGKMNEE